MYQYEFFGVIGQVESVYELQTISVMNKDTTKLEFALRNANDERLPCTLWGKFGEEVWSACRSSGERSVILVICFGKINVFKGDRRITSSCQTTKVLIHLNDPDAIVFKNSLPENCGRITFLSSKPQQWVSYGGEIHFDQFPMVTISELQDSLEVGKCKIMFTIYAVDTDWSWFYLVCTRYGKKVYKIPKKEDQKMTKKNKTLYSCETCDAKVLFVSARYKLHLCVMDDTSKIKCFLYDRNAQDILNQKVDEILKGNFDEIQESDVLPDALQNLIGKTFQFLICVEKENLYGGSNTYKVGKVWKGNDVLSVDEVNESEDMGDQSLLLPDSISPYEDYRCKHEIGQNYNENIFDHQHREGHVDYSSLGVDDTKDMYNDVVFPNKYWDSEDEYDYEQRFDCSSLDGSSDEENYIMDEAGEEISSDNEEPEDYVYDVKSLATMLQKSFSVGVSSNNNLFCEYKGIYFQR
ncbi:uncharacterized protein LOC18009904 [Eutrema salsugineum]|uniref:uncharacterized protein LOC18009904 n=1 Tax=Eutrema salsugineum TaxID=72664 RepID=UPI000CED4BE4|nr:uncharacterized protein LOC18009904 [Eutrema salsugineum]